MIKLIIYGEPCSMKNSREIARWGNKTGLRKSDAALVYESDVLKQVRTLPKLLEGRLSATAHCYYASERKDLDIDLLLDCLQGRIYKNDRQVREKHLYHHIDRANPRVEIEIRNIKDET